MKDRSSKAIHAFFSRVRPLIPELFHMAHAICGNYDLALYTLQYALMDAWVSETHRGVGFRESLRNMVRIVALEEALGSRVVVPEFTWNDLATEIQEPLLQPLAQERVEVRRMIVLYYGCGISCKRIARLMNLPVSQVREVLRNFEQVVRQKLPAKEKRRCEIILIRSVRRAMGHSNVLMPSIEAIYHNFETEAMETQRPRRFIARLLRQLIYIFLVLFLALMFWIVAVLVHPTEMESSNTLPTIVEFVP